MKDNMKAKWIEWEGKKVGFVLPYNNIEDRHEKVYVTKRKKPFKFRDRMGFSISVGVLIKRLQPVRVKSIRVIWEKEDASTSVYVTTFEKWLNEGEQNIYGYNDKQLFLPFEKFDKVGA